MKRARIFCLVRAVAALFALTTVVGVMVLPSPPSGAISCTPYTCGMDPGTGPISFTMKTLQHMTGWVEATSWPPVIGQTDYIRWDMTLQEDITAGKLIVDFNGPGGPIQSSSPICGGTGSRSPVIAASGPNVWAGGFVVWPVGTPASTPEPACPIAAGSYDTGLVPFTIPDTVQPGTYTGSIQVTDQAGSTVMLTSWQIVLQPPTTTTLSSSANPSVVDQPVTYTATVVPVPPATGTPTGTVTFNDGAGAIPGCTGVALDSSSTATCTTSGLAAGTHNITAMYGGDSTFAQSTSNPPLSQTVAGCPKGETAYLFTGTTKSPSTIYGLFCATKTGQATYQQGSALGSGGVNVNGSSNNFIALGPNVNLGGGTSGPTSQFTEVQPLKATGTYTLTKTS